MNSADGLDSPASQTRGSAALAHGVGECGSLRRRHLVIAGDDANVLDLRIVVRFCIQLDDGNVHGGIAVALDQFPEDPAAALGHAIIAGWLTYTPPCFLRCNTAK